MTGRPERRWVARLIGPKTEVATAVLLLTGVPAVLYGAAGLPLPRMLFTPDRWFTIDSAVVGAWLIWVQVPWAVGWEVTVAGRSASAGRLPGRAPLVLPAVADLVGRAVASVVYPNCASTRHLFRRVLGYRSSDSRPAQPPDQRTDSSESMLLARSSGGGRRPLDGRPPPTGRRIGFGTVLATGLLEARRRRRVEAEADPMAGSGCPRDIDRAILAEADPMLSSWLLRGCRSATVSGRQVPTSVAPAKGDTPVPLVFRLDDRRMRLTTDRPNPLGPLSPWIEERLPGDSSGRSGWCLSRSIPPAALGRHGDWASPLPALVMVSEDTIVNLEGVGVLGVDGDPTMVDGLIRALVAQLRWSALVGDVEVHVTDRLAARVGAIAGDSRPVETIAIELTTLLRRWADSGPNGSMYRFRLDQPAQAIPPIVVLASKADASALDAVVDWARSGVAPVAIVFTEGLPDGGGVWNLLVEGRRAVLEPLGLLKNPLTIDRSTAETLWGLFGPEMTECSSIPAAADRRLLTVGDEVDDGADLDRVPRADRRSRPMVCILGPVRIDGMDVELTSQQLSLVVFLSCVGPVGRTTLIDALWDGREVSPSRFGNLLAEVRAKIGRCHLPEAKGGLYALTGMDLDLEQLAGAVEELGEDNGADLRPLGEAFGLVRGIPLAAPADRHWSWIGQHEHLVARAEVLVGSACRELVVRRRNRGDFEAAVQACEQGLAASPLDESLTIELVGLYVTMGRTGAARRLVCRWEDGVRRLGCGPPSGGPRRRLANRSAVGVDEVATR